MAAQLPGGIALELARRLSDRIKGVLASIRGRLAGARHASGGVLPKISRQLNSGILARWNRSWGRVSLVGAGPGDPDLMTLRALKRLQTADVVIHDRLVGPEVLAHARRGAELIYVGKRKGRHAMAQDDINALMADRAETGARVVRLKGGDPFVFGRGAEELEYLRRRGIEAEVVPGITAALGCAASEGIPLTRRGRATALTLVTGHGVDGVPDLDWHRLAMGDQTLAVYMGVSTAPAIAGRLIGAGLSSETPVRIIENGTLPSARVVAARLGGLGKAISASDITGPALILIGEALEEAAEMALAAPLYAAA
jgi:uroporphyrin-III C-methyltransferase/precorrin-2 dehydrogenase/sirohydrochlorin ferrochelatase